MTEARANYEVSNQVGFTLPSLAKRDCARPFADPKYCPPTPEEVSGLIVLAGWSPKKTALLAGGACTDKGAPAIRKWKQPAGSREHREIPYAAWRLMLLHAGVVEFEKDIDFSDQVRKTG